MMLLEKGGSYDPYDKSARTKNTTSDWEKGLTCLADVPVKGQIVYVNRPQNNAYAEECKVEVRAKGVYIARSPVDNWGHYFTAYDVGNDIFYNYRKAADAINAMCVATCTHCNQPPPL